MMNIEREFGVSLTGFEPLMGTVQEFQAYILNRLNDIRLKGRPEVIYPILQEQLQRQDLSFQSNPHEIFPRKERRKTIARIESHTPLQFPSLHRPLAVKYVTGLSLLLTWIGRWYQSRSLLLTSGSVLLLGLLIMSLTQGLKYEFSSTLHTMEDLLNEIANTTYGDRETALQWNDPDEVKDKIVEILAQSLFIEKENIHPHSKLIEDLHLDLSD